MKDNDIIAAALAGIEKKYGEGAVLNPETLGKNVEFIPTGCFSVDYLLGGGVPRGRILEVYGSPSSGKTTMSLFIAGQLQKTGHKIAFIDVEQAYNGEWASKLGVQVSDMIVSQPSTVEESFDIIDALVATNQIDLVIVDSVEAMIPAKDLEDGALEKETIGVKARLLNKYLRVLVAKAAKTKTCILFINQTRANVGVMYGPKEITPGGNALKFAASIRVSVTKGEAFTDSGQQVGNAVKLTTKKNKVSFPFRSVELHIRYDSGIDMMQDTLDAALMYEVISRKGNTYSYGDTKLGVGKEQAKLFLRENKEVYDKIHEELKDKGKDTPGSEADIGDGEEG